MTDSINRSHIAQFPHFCADRQNCPNLQIKEPPRKRGHIGVFEAHDVQLVHARERRAGKMPELRIILDDGLVEEAHAAALAHQMPDELEAADADIRAKRLDRVAALHELSL